MIQQNISLKKHCNYRIGGNADFFSEVKTKGELVDVLSSWQNNNQNLNNICVLGEGTNILFSDEGFRGLVIKNNIRFIKRKNNAVLAGAGTLFSDLVSYYTQNAFSGLEWAGGLPGTVGGAIRGNAGAFGGETKGNIKEAESLSIKTLKTKKRTNKECGFDYRNSIFKSGEGRKEIILSASFTFKKGIAEEIKIKTQERIDHRIDKHPLEYPNIGSIFKNVDLHLVPEKVRLEFKDHIKKDPFPVIPVAKLILGVGLKGKSIGGAQISTKHPNFIVNTDNAKAEDVKELIEIVKQTVRERYNIALEEEVLVLPPNLP